ncbi:unnamed protein product, partial [Prorocentrum cordatum]
WGTGSSRTVEVEVDATVICKWKAEENAELTHSYYCFIGIRQRGSTSHFAMMPLGAYHAFCKEILGDRKYNLLLMTDGAGCYKCRCSDCVVRFEEHHSVNHSRKPKAEFSRPIPAVVADVDTGHTRGSMAGTMTIDKEWDLLKEPLPRNLTARTVEDVDRTDGYVRSQQWRRLVGNDDRWSAFLDAARDIPKRHPHAIATGMPTAAAPSIVTGRFSDGDLEVARGIVVAQTDDPPDLHVSDGGWYSHSVLATVLESVVPPSWRMLLRPLLPSSWQAFTSSDDMLGALAWWRILKHNDRVWHVDSLREPAILDEAAFGRALRRHPMAFPIVTNSYQE